LVRIGRHHGVSGVYREDNIGTNKREGFFVVIRLYSPGQSYFDKSWKPDDLVKLN
jgi:hypothetical protein